jgi:uncharacterized RDD family membrane protein YckC
VFVLALPSLYNRFAPEFAPDRPQRKNETVTQTCLQCGAINAAEAHICCLCDTRLPGNKNTGGMAAELSVETGADSASEDWRSEVVRRLDAYQIRHGRPRSQPGQRQLAFSAIDSGTPVVPAPAPVRTNEPTHIFETAPPSITKRRFRPKRVERFEIDLQQPAFDFQSADENSRPTKLNAAGSPYDTPALSVAPLIERRNAGVLDFGFVLCAYAVFLVLFRALGGRFSFSRVDALVEIGTLTLLYGQYVTLFTFFGAATPGMMLKGLRVVGLDGLEASPRQLLWRSFGYFVSAGTMMLGFLWSLWDEDQLSWHDRISQTCITVDDRLPMLPSNEHGATH